MQIRYMEIGIGIFQIEYIFLGGGGGLYIIMFFLFKLMYRFMNYKIMNNLGIR